MINWIVNNPIVTSVVGTLLVGILGFIATQVKKAIGSSSFSGVWEQLIYDKDNDSYKGEPIKRDEYNLNHSRFRYTGRLVINVTGTIKRIFPIGEQRQWDFKGYLDGDVLTMIYQSHEGQRSRGCIYVRLVRDYEFRGYYLEEHEDGTIDKTPLIIRRRDV